jgi:hypothetical protein
LFFRKAGAYKNNKKEHDVRFVKIVTLLIFAVRTSDLKCGHVRLSEFCLILYILHFGSKFANTEAGTGILLVVRIFVDFPVYTLVVTKALNWTDAQPRNPFAC